MRPYILLLSLSMAALSGCTPSRSAAPSATVPAAALLGAYELVSIGGRPLPVREFQATYHAGRITLNADGRFASEIDAEICPPGDACTRHTATAEGDWVMLPDGTLEFDPHEEEDPQSPDHDPLAGDFQPPRVEADGQEIRIYTASVETPIFLYRRR